MSKFSELYDLLSKLRSKQLSQSDYQQIKQAARKQARNSVNLWRFKPQIRVLFKMAKFQSYLMLILGLTVLPFTLYQKYQQDKQKLTKILIFSPFGFAACVGPVILYKRFSKKLIEAVSYSFESKRLILTRFKDSKEIYANLKDITLTRSDKGRIKQLVWKKNIQGAPQFPYTETRTYQIQGLGEWQSVQLLKYVVQKADKQSL